MENPAQTRAPRVLPRRVAHARHRHHRRHAQHARVLQHTKNSLCAPARRLRDWEDGVALLEGCMETHKTSTGLSPEGVSFHDPMNEPGGDWYIEDSNQQWPSYYARYMLRPEIVESLFIVWRLTGDKRYRDYPWAVFSVTEKHCRQKEACFVSSSTPHIPPFIHSFTRQFSQGGYATVMHVDGMPVVPLDKQETFVLSETLYLLTFSEGTLLPLKDIVFNTEAHSFPVFKRLSSLGLPSTCNS